MKRALRSVLALLAVSSIALTLQAADGRPTVSAISPAPGIVSALTNITITFSTPVVGVALTDLLVDAVPRAIALTGSNNVYTFTLEEQPGYGTVTLSWDAGHAIVDYDDALNRFNETAPGSTWQYTLVDTTAPTVASRVPAAGVTVRSLTQIEVVFSEAVAGVEAADLLINGSAAADVSVQGVGRYLFKFPQPTNGTVLVAWAAGHGIRDLAAAPNHFGGGSWSYHLDTGFGASDIRINEFVAANLSGLLDENGEPQDWLEVWNRGSNAVNLAGYALTDDNDDPGKWTFPATNLNPGQYLVVFLSAKDRRAPTGVNRFHTNFRINPSGDYLALFNAESPRVALTEFAPEYPEQRNNYSYGYDAAGNLKYFATPTPGAANGTSTISGIVPPPHFNVGRGLFDAPFTLILNSAVAGATIRYTTDGSEPTATLGTVYGGPLEISNTLAFRAIALGPNLLPSVTVTHTYIFLDQVLRQPQRPAGFPTNWGTHTTGFAPSNIVPADYEMDPEIVTNAAYRGVIKDAMKALPIVSIAIKTDDMFGFTNGIYTHPLSRGPAWERPCSMEMFFPDGTSAFQVNAGIQIQGNAAREPQKQAKHPMRVTFKGDYGPSRLDHKIFPDSDVTSFDTLILRSDFNFSWMHWSASQRILGQRTRDAFVKDTMRAMGSLASHNRYVHLYINGLYWGVYDPAERPDGAFAASYLGGEKEDYDIVNEGAAVDGNLTAYNTMLGIANLQTLSQYDLMKQYLDMTQFIDYMMLHFYIGHEDWGLNKNWYTMRKREPGQGFKYVPWDGENTLGSSITRNDVTRTDVPSGLHTKLVASTQYQLDFADRVHKHFFNGGSLMPQAVTNRWKVRAAQVDLPIIAESARWGDYRRDVHPFETAGPFVLFTRNNQWLAEQNRLLTQYLPQRTGVVLDQFRAVGLYPAVAAPVFNQHGGRVARGFNLTMTASNTIYFTLDGTDPRVYGTGVISPAAQVYGSPVVVSNSVLVKARALFNGTTWSALAEASFAADTLEVPLRITEIMYNPIGGDAYEFIELQNVGSAPLNIGQYSFEGITFIFAPNTILAPGVILILGSSSSPVNWTNRYPGVAVFGRFDASLANGGEKLAIKNPGGNTVYSVDYDDENGWPTAADGLGASLEVIDVFGDPDDPANWRASAVANGTPGTVTPPPASGVVVLNEVMADNLSTVNNGGTYPDWIELHNSGGEAVNLAGWSLTDDGDARKFVFPANTTLAAGGYLVVWCDSVTNTTPGLHTGFALGRNGESVFLYDAAASRVDAVTFGLQLSDFSVGRSGGAWHLTVPTPNAVNQAVALAGSTNLTINEWLADAVPGGDDWIELYNTSSNAPVALEGIYLGTSNVTFRMTSKSFIAPGGFVQLFADERVGADHLDFKLPAAGGAIVLYSEAGAELSRVTYGSQAQQVTQGRLPNGSPTVVSFPASPSPAASNYLLTYSGPILNEVLAVNQSAVTNGAGRTADFVELFNTNGAPFDLSGMRLSTDAGNPVQWIFPTGTMVPANGYLVVWFDDSLPASTAVGPVLNTGHSLDGDGGEVYLFSASGQPLDAVVFGFQAPNLPMGRSGGQWQLLSSVSPGGVNDGAATLASPAGLRLNEWMANPVKGDDWFEIYNPASQPVALAGLYLADSPEALGQNQFQVPPLSFIGAKGFVKWIADAAVASGRNHVDFSLDANGEALRISSAALGVIDSVYFGFQPAAVSQGRLPDGAPTIVSFPVTPTPGTLNYLPLLNAVINEVLTHTDPPLEDAIEIYNPTGQGIDVSGWFLSNSQDNFKKYRFPNGTFLAAGGYLVLYEAQFNSGAPGSFTLNAAHGDAVYLSEADAAGNLGGHRAVARFGAAANGVSFGRFVTCLGADFTTLSARTFGQDAPGSLGQFRAGAGLFNAYPNVGPVVLSELMYHPPDLGTNDNTVDEYIELCNITASPVPLFDPAHTTNTWRLRGGVAFTFPQNVTLAAGACLLVVSFDPVANPAQLAAFRALYTVPGEVPVFGPYTGKLENGGESVELKQPDAPQTSPHPDAGFVPYLLVDRVEYDDLAPWPVGADGGGASLQRRVSADYGNDPMNWVAAGPGAGQPNPPQPTQAPLIVSPPVGRAVSANSRVVFSVSVCGTRPLSYQWKRNGVNLSGATGVSLVLASVQPSDVGDYTVLVSNAAGMTSSVPATLTLMSPPVITVQPESQTGGVAGSVTFTVQASGTGPFSYQWRFNGTPISGATGAALMLNNLGAANIGDYSVVVSNPAGGVASATAQLLIVIPPMITAQPQSVTTNPGSNVTFSVTATGNGPVRYQWRRFGTNLPNATSATLELSDVQLADNGPYAVVVTDDITSAVSQTATLTVLVRPVITQQPVGQTVLVGSDVNFSISATGTLPLSFRWRKGSTTLTNMIVSENTAVFTITNVQTSDAGSYNVAITNVAGNAPGLSANAVLTVLAPPVIVTQPTNQTVDPGSDALLAVRASGTAPLSYQWHFNGLVLTGATSTNLFLTNVQPARAGSYTVIITNVAGVVTSQVAVLTVPSADSDGDGLPDAWETAHGLNPNDPGDAALDKDGDGMTNLQEFLAGTDPSDTQSYLKLEILGGGSVRLQFNAVAGKSYTVEYRDALGGGTWARLSDVEATTANRVVEVSDPAGSPTRFYRLRTPKQP